MKTNKSKYAKLGIAMAIVGALVTPVAMQEASAATPNAESDFSFNDSTGTILGYKGTSKDVVIPETIGGVTVKSIVTNAFYDKKLTSITIPNSVTSIGFGAFSSNKLTSVTIPNSITSIGGCAFAHNQLTSITIPNSVTSIGYGAFAGNKLTSVTIPNSVTSIGDSTFQYNIISTIEIENPTMSVGSDILLDQYTDSTKTTKKATTDITIKAPLTSTAQTYATANGHTFVELLPQGTEKRNVQATIESGELTYTTPSIIPFGTIKLKKEAQTIGTKFNNEKLTITDARGTGEGWRLQLESTVFKTLGSLNHELGAGKLSIAKPISIKQTGTNDTTGLTTPLPDEYTSIDGIGVIPIAVAQVGHGKGTTEIVFPSSDVLKLVVDPTDVIVGKEQGNATYTATLTWSLVNAPE